MQIFILVVLIGLVLNVAYVNYVISQLFELTEIQKDINNYQKTINNEQYKQNEIVIRKLSN